MPSSRPCSEQRQRLPNWKAVQLGKPIGTVVTTPRSRYVLSPSSPCAMTASSSTRGQRTRCFSPLDNRSKRKQCTLLSPTADFPNLFPSGLHLSGVGVLRDHAFTCNYSDRVEMEQYHVSLEDSIDPYVVTVLGPFPNVDTNRLMILCTATINFSALTSEIDPLSFATVFTTYVSGKDPVSGKSTREAVRYVPTLQMLRNWSDALNEGARQLPVDLRAIPRGASRLVSLMETQFAHLEDLKRECAAHPELRSTARTIVRNLFTMAMYARRWQGPGTPYPIQNSGKVGTQRRPVSESLRGKYSALMPTGSVRISERKVNSNYAEADFVNSEGRLEVLESQHLLGAMRALKRLPQVQQEFLETKMRASLETVYCVDGTFWPSHEVTLVDLANLVLLGLNDDRSCLRRNSMHIATTCKMLCPYVYASEPTWIKYEGLLRRLDVTGH